MPKTASDWHYIVHYHYDSIGTLDRVYGADETHPYWTLTSVDAAGAVTDTTRNGSAVTVTHLHDRATGAVTGIQARGWSETIAEAELPR